MSTSELKQFFEDRFNEITTYVDLLQDIEIAARSGPPRLEGASSSISAAQQKILYSSVYLQLYNLVEAIVSRCLDEVVEAATNGDWLPADLNPRLFEQWVRINARTHIDLTPENRLKAAVWVCDNLIQRLRVTKFKFEVGGGGNWDDTAIEEIGLRVGCKLAITAETRLSVKRHIRNSLGALELVKVRRNELAHGSISFVECSDGVLVSELRNLASTVGRYLKEAIACFVNYIEIQDYLHPDRKHGGAL